MKVEVVERDGEIYAELTPRPNAKSVASIKQTHYDYDFFETIEQGKRYYKINNPQSLRRVTLVDTPPHSKVSPLFTDELIEALEHLKEKGSKKLSATRFANWLNASETFVIRLLN